MCQREGQTASEVQGTKEDIVIKIKRILRKE